MTLINFSVRLPVMLALEQTNCLHGGNERLRQ